MRRLRRAHLVGDILSELDFRIEIKEDAVFARLDGRGKEYMCDRLKALGYIIIHTRQLDMIMDNTASTNNYWTKITKDLNSIVDTRRNS